MKNEEFDNMKFQIEEKLTKSIAESVDIENYSQSTIRILDASQRMSENEVYEKYDIVYSVIIKYQYTKKVKAPMITVTFQKNGFEFNGNRFAIAVLMRLEPEDIILLSSWSKSAAKTVNHLLSNQEYYLREIQFDMVYSIVDNHKEFIVPYLLLEQIHFSKTKNGTDFINIENYVNSKIAEKKSIEQSALYQWIKSEKEKKEGTPN